MSTNIDCVPIQVFCPTGAIKEVDHTPRVMRALMDPEMIVVLQTAPSVRVTLSEMFGTSDSISILTMLIRALGNAARH